MKKGTRNLAAALKPKDQDPKGKKIDLALLGAFRPMDPVEDSTNSGATLISSQSSSGSVGSETTANRILKITKLAFNYLMNPKILWFR